jgi:hypothetical protein
MDSAAISFSRMANKARPWDAMTNRRVNKTQLAKMKITKKAPVKKQTMTLKTLFFFLSKRYPTSVDQLMF